VILEHALDHCFHGQIYQPDCSSQADVALSNCADMVRQYIQPIAPHN
jgi:hypothetical protein